MTGRAVAAAARSGRSGALWRFSRPHTIIGTTVSIVALYLIAVATLPGLALGGGLCDLFWTLVAGLAVNVYIVGINQLEDVEIDRVNKPFLPLAAGEMTLRDRARRSSARRRRWPIVLAITQGASRRSRCSPALAVGTAYSLPPLRLKRFPVAASLCISGVRSVVVNLGVYAHFSLALGPDGTVAIPARGVGADDRRAAVLVRDRDPQGRPRRRGRPALPDPDLHRAGRRREGAAGRGSRCSRSPTSGWRCSGRC